MRRLANLATSRPGAPRLNELEDVPGRAGPTLAMGFQSAGRSPLEEEASKLDGPASAPTELRKSSPIVKRLPTQRSGL